MEHIGNSAVRVNLNYLVNLRREDFDLPTSPIRMVLRTRGNPCSEKALILLGVARPPTPTLPLRGEGVLIAIVSSSQGSSCREKGIPSPLEGEGWEGGAARRLFPGTHTRTLSP
jgi:hypothetical protein